MVGVFEGGGAPLWHHGIYVGIYVGDNSYHGIMGIPIVRCFW